MSRRKSNGVVGGLPRGGYNAASKRAASWLSQEHARFNSEPLGAGRKSPEQAAGSYSDQSAQTNQFPVLIRYVTTWGLRSLIKEAMQEEGLTIFKELRLKSVPEAMGLRLVRRFSFDHARARMAQLARELPESLSYQPVDAATFRVRDNFFVAFDPDADTKAALSAERQRAMSLLGTSEAYGFDNLTFAKCRDETIASRLAQVATHLLVNPPDDPSIYFGQANLVIETSAKRA